MHVLHSRRPSTYQLQDIRSSCKLIKLISQEGIPWQVAGAQCHLGQWIQHLS